jgi:hypothetical protein
VSGQTNGSGVLNTDFSYYSAASDPGRSPSHCNSPRCHLTSSMLATKMDEEVPTPIPMSSASTKPSYFGDQAFTAPRQSASRDFSLIPVALGTLYTFWALGGSTPRNGTSAEAAGRLAADIPANHSPQFAPVIEPTLKTGTTAIVVAALAWLS